MKIYTRTGDDGTTSLSGGKRIPKYHARIEAYGSVEELISWIGLLKDYKRNRARRKILIYIQNQLMYCAASLAAEADYQTAEKSQPDANSILLLEQAIDKMEKKMKPLKSFILPGGNKLVSHCHIARCVCRRAERAVYRLNQTDKIPDTIMKFLNRLGDFLFVLSRKISFEIDIEEIRWPV